MNETQAERSLTIADSTYQIVITEHAVWIERKSLTAGPDISFSLEDWNVYNAQTGEWNLEALTTLALHYELLLTSLNSSDDDYYEDEYYEEDYDYDAPEWYDEEERRKPYSGFGYTALLFDGEHWSEGYGFLGSYYLTESAAKYEIEWLMRNYPAYKEWAIERIYLEDDFRVRHEQCCILAMSKNAIVGSGVSMPTE